MKRRRSTRPVRERGIEVDHVTLYRWVQRFTSLIIDAWVSKKRDVKAATRFFARVIGDHGEPVEVTTDRSPAWARTIVELLPGTHHETTQYANNCVEVDHD